MWAWSLAFPMWIATLLNSLLHTGHGVLTTSGVTSLPDKLLESSSSSFSDELSVDDSNKECKSMIASSSSIDETIEATGLGALTAGIDLLKIAKNWATAN